MVYEEPKKMLLYGDACRVSTDPIAKASYFFDLIQISYADTDPIYTIENYPNFFRVVPSENALSLARIPFIRHFNWTHVGTIYQNLPRYSLPHSKLLTDLERYKIVIKQSVSLPGSIDGLQNRDLGDELRKLKEKDVRIILGNFDEEWALLLFCEAYREKMTGRKYQWILTGVSEDKLWQHYQKKGSECSEQELLIAMDGYIITDITPVTRSQHKTISGMLAHEYSNEYRRRALEMNISIEENKFYGYVYDGIWAIALALNRVDAQLRYYNKLVEDGKAKLNPELQGINSLLDFDYHRPIWVKLIRNALNKTRFNGVTAFRDMNEVIIGSYDALNDVLDLNVGFPIFWRGSSPPIDYTIERVTPFRINRTLFIIISIFALFGIVLATLFLIINIKFRNQRYIKMSSPYLNNLIIIGCILTYTSVIILGLDSGLTSEYNFPYICNARAWVLMAGFTLAFGSMFSKTFRVHSIFTNIKLHKKVIKDYKLFMVVFILLTFDVCILIVWQYFDPFYRETNNGTSIQDPDNEDIIIVPEMEHCQSKRMTIFLSVIYVYKGLLMAFGCFLAWETRHVSIPALNDSKYIGLSVYNVVIMCVIGAGLSFVLRDQQDASFVIISIFIIFCSTTTLCLVFVPKLIELKQNPRAGDHRVRATLKTFKKNYHEEAFGAATSCRDIHGNIIGRGYGANLNERIKILLDENIKQRSVLKEKTYELEALTYKYRKIQGMIQSGQYLQALSTTGSGNRQSTKQLSSSKPKDQLGTNIVPATLVSMNTPAKPQNLSSCTTSRVSPESGTQITDITTTNDNGRLQRSSFISSMTQSTTTNTTSSINNTSDITNDCSSSKLASNISSATNTTNFEGMGKRALVAFGCNHEPNKLELAPEKPTILEPVDRPGTGKQASLAVEHEDHGKFKVVKKQLKPTDFAKQPSKYATDSSYCSMGADYEFGDSRKTHDDLNLFNLLSYIADSNGQDQHNHTNSPRKHSMERKFNCWSKGPFCTLMVRNNDQTDNGNALADDRPDNNISSGIEIEKTGVIRASCPDIRAPNQCSTEAEKFRRSNRTNLQKNSDTNSKDRQLVKNRLPRTISMIEYLGLSDFDFIARRHEGLFKKKLQSRERQYACCAYDNSCSCCDQSTKELDIAFSSGELGTSGNDLARSGSHLSCSTCCSLISPSYFSQTDDMFDDTTQSGRSISTVHSNSSTDSTSSSLKHYHSRSSSSSSSFDNQESAIQITKRNSCAIHQQAASKQKSRIHQHHRGVADTERVFLPSIPTNKSITGILRSTFKKQSNDQDPLCTSGMLYGPGSKEDSNLAAQVSSRHVRTGGDLSSNVSTTILENLSTEVIEGDHLEPSIIKCDILERL